MFFWHLLHFASQSQNYSWFLLLLFSNFLTESENTDADADANADEYDNDDDAADEDDDDDGIRSIKEAGTKPPVCYILAIQVAFKHILTVFGQKRAGEFLAAVKLFCYDYGKLFCQTEECGGKTSMVERVSAGRALSKPSLFIEFNSRRSYKRQCTTLRRHQIAKVYFRVLNNCSKPRLELSSCSVNRRFGQIKQLPNNSLDLKLKCN